MLHSYKLARISHNEIMFQTNKTKSTLLTYLSSMEKAPSPDFSFPTVLWAEPQALDTLRGKHLSAFKASLVYMEFQDSQGYIQRPCLTNKNKASLIFMKLYCRNRVGGAQREEKSKKSLYVLKYKNSLYCLTSHITDKITHYTN